MFSVNKNKWKEGSLLTLLVLIFIAILTGVALIVHRFPLRWDLTEGNRHSLSAQSLQIVKNIKEDVRIRAFFQEGNPDKKNAQALLNTYAYANPRIRFQFIDPDRQPALARQYGVRNYGALILESGGRTRNVPSAEEEEISGGLLRLMQSKAKRILFLTGHGEKGLQDTEKSGYSLARSLLEKENYRVEEISLMAGQGVPEGSDCLIIAGPKKPLFPQEIEDLKKFIAAGGRVILLLEPFQDNGLKDWLSTMGVTLHQDILIDKVSRIFGGDFLIPMAGSYGRHPITEKFNVPTFFPTARSLQLASSPTPGFTPEVLIRSSSESWAEFDKSRLDKGEASFEPTKDRRGPLNLSVLITLAGSGKTSPEPPSEKNTPTLTKGRLVVFGDSDFASNGYFNLSGNGDLFLNTINHLTEEQQLISIRPAKSPVKPLSLSAGQAQALFLIPLVLLPLVVIGAGVAVWRSRRKAR
ncbi:MAG: GldG family protein [Thermodesulfobacteriota bacterium]